MFIRDKCDLTELRYLGAPSTSDDNSQVKGTKKNVKWLFPSLGKNCIEELREYNFDEKNMFY